jgi:sortase A
MMVLRTLGKFLISVGVGVLLFVAWTLWGTGLLTERAQAGLEEDFDRQPAVDARELSRDGVQTIEVDDSFQPAPGEAVFRIVIPKIDVRAMVVEGVETEQLRQGPGHYPDCRRGFNKPLCTPQEAVWPGEVGRVIISGHRTTYGGPFYDIDRLREGDEIQLETKWGDFTYEVTGSEIVAPNAQDIATPISDRPELVLTTCNPRFSAAERLIVSAELTEASLL